MTSLPDNPTALEARTYWIYCITNAVNGKQYVGQTKEGTKKRWMYHVRDAFCTPKNRGCPILCRAIRKYGKDAFVHNVLEVVHTLEESNLRETFWIKELNTLSPRGYNCVSGGGVRELSEETRLKMSGRKGPLSPNFGKKFSEEHRKRISAAKLGQKYRPMSEEVRQKHARGMKGKTHSESAKERIRESKIGVPRSAETKEKLRLANLGKKFSEERKKQISQRIRGENNPFYGKTHSSETKEKMRVSHLGRTGKPMPPATREAVRLANLGKPCSLEKRKKISETLKAKNAAQKQNEG
jgi:group I intron endonuclease